MIEVGTTLICVDDTLFTVVDYKERPDGTRSLNVEWVDNGEQCNGWASEEWFENNCEIQDEFIKHKNKLNI